MGKIRQPQKINSIEKKNKIIESGLVAFTNKGYYKTTTAEIAKIAGVSTGIVYSYFKDKKDIFLHSLDLYFDNLYSPILNTLKSIKLKDFESSLKDIINMTMESHRNNASSHEEFVAMSHLDEDVHKRFMIAEEKLSVCIKQLLDNNNIFLQNVNEKIHIAYNLIESLCHEFVFHKHQFINYQEMISQTINLIKYLFNE